jgi:hypothetical protein
MQQILVRDPEQAGGCSRQPLLTQKVSSLMRNRILPKTTLKRISYSIALNRQEPTIMEREVRGRIQLLSFE